MWRQTDNFIYRLPYYCIQVLVGLLYYLHSGCRHCPRQATQRNNSRIGRCGCVFGHGMPPVTSPLVIHLHHHQWTHQASLNLLNTYSNFNICFSIFCFHLVLCWFGIFVLFNFGHISYGWPNKILCCMWLERCTRKYFLT